MEDWGPLSREIAGWIREYAEGSSIQTLVVGVSGGVDSAVTSTLAAMTGLDTIVVNMPIHQESAQFDLSNLHIEWLEGNWRNVDGRIIDLTATFDRFSEDLRACELSDLALANSRARLRMATLFAIASSSRGIVVGTGNKVEDFGVGFFTKYGDGGVDISPIADLLKSEVSALAEEMGILQEIRDAAPTDGLWEDSRTDEEQIGATYEELEWAMREVEGPSGDELTERENRVLEIYRTLHEENSHKMKPIPVFKRSDKDPKS